MCCLKKHHPEFRYLLTYQFLVKRIKEYRGEEFVLHEKVTLEILRVMDGTAIFIFFYSFSERYPQEWFELYLLHPQNIPSSFWKISGLNVRHAAFSDPQDKFFETESEVHKLLLTKIPTVANPYIFLPEQLKKLMEQHHPRKLFKINVFIIKTFLTDQFKFYHWHNLQKSLLRQTKLHQMRLLLQFLMLTKKTVLGPLKKKRLQLRGTQPRKTLLPKACHPLSLNKSRQK